MVIPDMKFRRLDTRDGLSNSQVNCIFQDSRGFIWVGTAYGLNRYDGYRFRTFYSDASDTTSLRSNYVDQMFEDREGRLWLRQSMNYSIFDPVTERVVRNPSAELAQLGITGGIDRIYFDDKKNLWVKSYDDGLYYYNFDTKKLTLTKYGYAKDEIPKEFYFSSFAEYKDNLLVASSDGDMMAIDRNTGMVVWKDSYMRQNGGHSSDAYTIKVDNFGNYWILTNGTTFIYHQKEKKWYPNINSFLETKNIEALPEGLQVWDVMMDHRGWLWIATDHEGLIIIDPKSKEVRQFQNNKLDESSLSDNTVKHLLIDKAGNVWIGAYRNGINQYIEKPSGFLTLELGDINTTVEDKQGYYWLGTDNRGVIKYNPRTGESQLFDKATSGFSSDIMVSSCSAKDGSVWFGTYGGGVIRIARDGHVTNYVATGAEGGLLNNNVWSVTEDKWGDIWMGTLGNGVQRLNLKTGKFRTWSSYNTPLKENFMTTASWIKNGWLMVGHSQFFSFINPVTGKVLNFTIPNIPGQPAAMATTTCAMEDSRGLFWQGSPSGCCIVNRHTGKQTLLDMNSGLFGSSVVGIAEDNLGTMWVVTEHGISNVTAVQQDDGDWSFIVRTFNSSDGLQQGPYNQRSISCTHDGLILVGGLNGVDVINPKQVGNVANKETPIFSGLKLFGQLMGVGQKYGGRVILTKALNDGRELYLKYYENQFTIQLGTDKGEIHNPSRFIYMLEGFSDTWIKTEETDPNITYMSLPSGSYTLHVRMLNDNGTMGEVESLLKIEVSYPWYRSWLAYFLYLLAIAAAGWWLYKEFIRRQRERMELERLRSETEKQHWMSEMKRQMNRPQPSADGTAKDDEAPAKAAEQLPVTAIQADLIAFLSQLASSYHAFGDKPAIVSFASPLKSLVMPFDADLLQRAVTILLNNSVKYSPRLSRITIDVAEADHSAVIHVTDNGVGVPEEARSFFFEPIDGQTPDLDLNFVKRVAEAHHGAARLVAKSGGTVIELTLPVTYAGVEEIPIEEAEVF